jgi:carboxyl-terminal processing protease
MKSATRSAHRFTILVFACVFGALNCAGRNPVAAVPPDTTEANVTRLTAGLLESSQLAHHPLDQDLAGTFLDNYLDALDGTHSVLLKSDIDEFAAYRATLAQTTRATGDTRAARAIFRRFLERVQQRSAFVAETLKTAKFDYSGHESFSADRQHAPRPRDLTEAKALWRAQLSAEYLQEKLADTAPAQIASKLTRRYAQQAETMKGLNNEEVLEVYLNSLAHVYDPHSDYMGHGQLEGFSISMNLSLFGIGAALENTDGYCTVRETIAGGPAARNGALKPGDRIVAVAQAGKEPVDIVNIPLSRAVELIRGPKGSRVTLSILPAGAQEGAPPTQVALVRDKIQLEDQAAKARVIDLPRANGSTLRLGVIDLPGFYANMGENAPEQHSATADVAKLINKLKREKVQGIALDLRRNGGGSLTEAITLTGLFIKKGPVVQTRGAAGEVEVQTDPDASVLYDGPLLLLTSRFSASATEILAGALQDYGRALVVGDSQTFGKGTVQSVLPLGPVMDKNSLAHSYDPGALKVTVSMFYRPNGASTQLRGVASDIVLPSTSDFSEVSESALNNALPWGSVKPAGFERLNRVAPYLGALRERSTQRIAQAPEFAELATDVQRVKKSLTEKTVSLNEAERREELAQNKARKAQRERDAAARRSTQPVTYEVTLKNAASPGLARTPAPPPAANPQAAHNASPPPDPNANDEVAAQKADEDTLLNEGVKILADYTELLHGPVKGSEPSRATSR